jgi:hypothetical protein
MSTAISERGRQAASASGHNPISEPVQDIVRCSGVNAARLFPHGSEK